ncbi:MAG: alpha/beta hydrolase [Acidimicrobiales bacterium]
MNPSSEPTTNLVFLPGSSGHGSFWDPIREQLDDYPSEALDWPGLGGHPPSPAVRSFDDLVDWTIEQITTPSALIGQSMGGFVAMRVAIARPDLVTHLVLAVTSAGIDRQRLGLDEWHLRAQPGDAQWVADPQPALDEYIAGVRVPCLLLWADEDPISPLPLGRRLQELIPGAILTIYSSDDHWVVLEHAADVARQIRELTTPDRLS